ncbi:THI6 [[Candida] subhashii]|uniref:THI6 n=1 Tax=[Candida] subhashii TaxID=561895 RepID=A0A8J5QL87_9ASCO|nr:THI6 [[Candida] subhashii]KAG7664198.1 THI6 [[Candida] subhashii]
MSQAVDYSLYLVTDSTMIPESCTFLGQVEQAIDNGATIIQLREKSLSTLDFIERAEKVHELTKKRGIPLIINDRVDVALAIDAEGVHVGQDDMPAKLVRKLIGNDKILGVTCSVPSEVEAVIEEGIADYVGLGTVYKTETKKNVTDPEGTGPIGVRKMLQVLHRYNSIKENKRISSVAIGGINHSNADKVMYQCSIPGQAIDGVAVVSCIMANEDAGKATRELLVIIKSKPIWVNDTTDGRESDVRRVIAQLTESHPLVHHITNNVVKNFSANVTLAIGASPIMSELPAEYEEFASGIPNIGLLLNLGTPTDELMAVFKHAILVYNKYGKPIVFDPVACGATQARLERCRILLNTGQFTVIKGNVGEIMGIWKLTSSYKASDSDDSLMRGVDSVAKLTPEQIVEIGKKVSIDFKTMVVITGPENYMIQDDKAFVVPGGSKLMGLVTGSGCSLGSTIAAFLAAKADGKEMIGNSFDAFKAVVNAVRLYNTAGSEAATRSETPASFMIDFVDQLYKLTNGTS